MSEYGNKASFSMEGRKLTKHDRKILVKLAARDVINKIESGDVEGKIEDVMPNDICVGDTFSLNYGLYFKALSPEAIVYRMGSQGLSRN